MPIHLFLAHFPVVLFVVGAGIDAAGAAVGDGARRRLGGQLLIAGALAALLVFFTGQGALSALLMRERPSPELLEAHTQWGGAGVWALVGAGALRAAWRNQLGGTRGWINLAVALAAAALCIAITLSGSAIQHGA